MIKWIDRKYTKDEVLGLLDPIIREWFESKFNDLTEPQAYAIPYIHAGENVLVSAPTGSGKTLTGFLTIINELFLLAKEGKLENNVYCVYVSPLKALANDIHRNLEEPLEEIKNLAKEKGIEIPKITVGVRSGDTPQSQRQKMLKKPPHIFITTPESLALVLSSIKFKEKFRSVRYAIVDETHELSSSKRGVMLSINLERLERLSGHIVRIGLSATQSPIEEMAKFVAGYDDNGEVRDIYIAEVEAKKSLDLRVITPVPDLVNTPYEIANEKMYDILVDLINSHRTTLIFTNTRSGTEHVAFKLKERGIKSLEAHHSSLGKATRLRVEEMLKRGELKCVISSTSLELGIDIGYIDLVVQIGSPKSIAKGLQRIGRSGHAYGKVSKGRMVVFDMDDLIECTVLTKEVYENNIDRIFVPKNSLDVLSQVIVGMSLEDVWNVDDAYSLIKKSYCYRELTFDKFMEVIDYLSGKTYGERFYSKIWYDENERKFGKKRSTRMIYFMNMGTIPEEADYVVLDENNVPLGDLSEKFVEHLRQGDIFVLGGRTYEFFRARGSKVYVKKAEGRRPTVPSWAGEMLPRSFDLSIEVGKFRKMIEEKIKNKEDVINYLIDEYYLDKSGAVSIYKYIMEQMSDTVPTDELVFLEGYIDPSKMYNIIFHFPFGRRVNDALSRVYAHNIANKFGLNTRITVTDDAFMITIARQIPINSILGLVNSDNLVRDLKNALKNTELFKQRFRHCATRSFMVLKKYKGADISVTKQQLKSDKILEMLSEIPNFPVIEETYNEIFNIVMDMPHAIEIMEKIESGNIGVKIKDYSDQPSVFSNNVILSSISDIVLMEDRSALLKEIHMKILKKVLPEEYGFMFNTETIKEYFSNKFSINGKDGIIDFIREVGAADINAEKGINIFSFSTLPFDDLKAKALELVKEGILVSAYTDKSVFTLEEFLPYYRTVYGRDIQPDERYEKIINIIDGKTTTEAWKASGMKREDFMEVLRDLERAYIIFRKDFKDNEILWGRRIVEKAERNDSLRFIVEKTLNYYGPLTLSEIAFYANSKEKEIEHIMDEMEKDGIVKSGLFLPGYEKQYMLKNDFENLKNKASITKEDIIKYRFNKTTRKFDNIIDAFSYYIYFSTPYEASIRVRNFNFQEWENMRIGNEIIYGRFLGNRFIFVHRSSAQSLKIKNIALDEQSKNILMRLATKEKASIQEISDETGLHPRTVRGYINILENNFYVARSFSMDELKGPGNKYTRIEVENGNPEDLLEKMIKNIGPFTINELADLTGMDQQAIRETITNLKLKTFEVSNIIYYGEINREEYTENSEILDFQDPFLYPYRIELLQKFGPDFNYYLVKNGNLEGALWIDESQDSLSIINMNVPENDLELAIEKIIGISEFYDDDIVIIEKINNKEPMEYLEILKKFGFKKHGKYFIKGNVYRKDFQFQDLERCMFYRQGIDIETRKKTPMDLDNLNMGIRTEFEIPIRCWHFISAERLKRSNLLYLTRGIPDQSMYASTKNIKLFQAIKNAQIDKKHEIVIKMFRGRAFVSPQEIIEESPLGRELTSEIINYLFHNNYIAKGPRDDMILIESDITRKNAISKYIENIYKMFGAINVRRISLLMKDYATQRELKETIRNVAIYYNLKKVFFDDEIFYTNPEEIELLKERNIDYEFILDQHDILYQYMLPDIRKQVKPGYSIIIRGTSVIGSFRSKIKKKELQVFDYEGNTEGKNVIKSIAGSMGLKVGYVERMAEEISEELQ